MDIIDDKVVYHEEEDVLSSQLLVPYEGMEFHTLDEARKAYNDYTFKMSFSIRVGSSRNNHVSKQLTTKKFECTQARRPAE